jgi:hypothetical protein
MLINYENKWSFPEGMQRSICQFHLWVVNVTIASRIAGPAIELQSAGRSLDPFIGESPQ